MNYDVLFSVAKKAIDHGLVHDSLAFLDPFLFQSEFNKPAECFITLHKANFVYGCVGNPFVTKSFIDAVLYAAFNAAYQNVKAQKINRNLLPALEITLSHLLSERNSWKVEYLPGFVQLIKPDHTLILHFENYSATLLSTEQTKFSSLDNFVIDARKKALIPDSIGWKHITATLIPTVVTTKAYKDIPCLITD